MTSLITDPLVSSAQRERALAPSTTCVAFSARAICTMRLPDVGSGDLVVATAELLEECAVLFEADRVVSPRARRPIGRERR